MYASCGFSAWLILYGDLMKAVFNIK